MTELSWISGGVLEVVRAGLVALEVVLAVLLAVVLKVVPVASLGAGVACAHPYYPNPHSVLGWGDLAGQKKQGPQNRVHVAPALLQLRQLPFS